MLTATFLSLLLSSSVISFHPVSRNSSPFSSRPTELYSEPADFEPNAEPEFFSSARAFQPPELTRPDSKRGFSPKQPRTKPNSDRSSESSPSKCRRILVRREVRRLDPTQKNSLFQTLKKLNSAPHPNTYDNFARQHNENNKIIHSAPVFLIWHRMFLRRFEQELQKIDPSVALAYWDWTKDSNAPEKSRIFSNDYFGGDSQGCVKSGSFADWKVHYPQPHCLTRRWNKGLSANDTSSSNGTPVLGKFVSSYVMDAIIDQSKTFEKFRLQIENVPHSYPHTWIGGDMTTMHSPNDPIFYFHHGFIDKLFDEWQQEDGARYVSYSGRNKDGSTATLDDPLTTLNARVREAMNVRSLCYTYEDRLQRRSDPPPMPLDNSPAAPSTPVTGPTSGAGEGGSGKIASLMGMALDIVDSVIKKPEEKKNDDNKYTKPVDEPKENDQKVEIKMKKKKKHHKSKYLNFNKKEAKCVAARLEEEIQIPELIPECWIKLNGYDVKTVRRIEASFSCLVRKINKQYRLLKSSTSTAPSDSTINTSTSDASKNDNGVEGPKVDNGTNSISNGSLNAASNTTTVSDANSTTNAAQTNNTSTPAAASVSLNSSNGTTASANASAKSG